MSLLNFLLFAGLCEALDKNEALERENNYLRLCELDREFEDEDDEWDDLDEF